MRGVEKMPILALDTATLVSGVAVATTDTLLAELTIQTGKTHSEQLMPNIAEVLRMAGIQKKALKGIAVSIGPGSFTGLRIGLATAKSLAYALNVPLIGVPTLAAIAYNCPVPGVVCAPLLDAQKGNVYQALFTWDGVAMQELQAPKVLPLVQALEEMLGLDRPVVILGEAAALYREQIIAAGGRLSLALPHIAMPRPASVAALGYKMLQSGLVHDIAALEPLYIRRSEAEVLWEQRHGGML